MSEANPLFSVIIPTFNRPEYLKEAVGSILAQHFSRFEIIIIDDHSNANYEAELAAIAATDPRVVYIRNAQNMGVSASRNIGLNHVNGEYIIFLDDDDCIVGNYLEIAHQTFTEAEDTSVVIFPAVPHPDSNKNLLRYHNIKETLRAQPFKRRYNDDTKLLVKYPPQINSMVFRKDIFSKHQFDTSISFGEDLYLWMMIVQENFQFSEKIPRNSGASALIRVHGIYHLSQTTHEDVLDFLRKVKSNHAAEDSGLKSVLDLKIFMRLILMRKFDEALGILISGLRTDPISFFIGVLSQFRVKMRILLSYALYKVFKFDI